MADAHDKAVLCAGNRVADGIIPEYDCRRNILSYIHCRCLRARSGSSSEQPDSLGKSIYSRGDTWFGGVRNIRSDKSGNSERLVDDRDGC